MPRHTGSFDPGRNWYAIVASGAVLSPRPKALYASAAGTITAAGDDGVPADFVVAGPGAVPISPVKVTAWTGGAGTLIAVYD